MSDSHRDSPENPVRDLVRFLEEAVREGLESGPATPMEPMEVIIATAEAEIAARKGQTDEDFPNS